MGEVLCFGELFDFVVGFLLVILEGVEVGYFYGFFNGSDVNR